MQILREQPGAFRDRRDVVWVVGPDAARFLQGQLSQEVEGLAPGESAWSFLLEPQGHVVAWLRIHRLEEERFLLDLEEGFGWQVELRLSRFLLRTRAEVTVDTWDRVAVRGHGTESVDPTGTGAALASPVDWAGVPGMDLLGAAVTIPEGLSEVDADTFHALRIEAGVPAMGHEFEEGTIPAEAGVVPISVSFTKGCYTGQELVARVDSRGNNTPRRLRAVVIEGDERPPVGAELVAGPDVVGRITSVARSPLFGSVVALAYIHRKVDVPAELLVRWDGDDVLGEAVDLPLVRG